MTAIVDFDSNALKGLLSKFGIRKTWLSLLATNLQSHPHLEYVLNRPEFDGAVILDEDLIGGLTIGETSVLYEFSVAVLDPNARKSKGQFFTPDDVAEFMARFSEDFPEGKWLDPCSGIGNLTWHLVSRQDNPEEFLLNRMILSDLDELALLIARTLMTISFQQDHSQLFDEIKDNFKVFDFLSASDNGNWEFVDQADSFRDVPVHDFVIVNPPYLASGQNPRFECARAGDLYAYFLENVIKTSKGFISITPQSFTNASKFKELRTLLLEEFRNVKIFNFDNIPGNIFRGIKFGSRNTNTANSIRAAVVVALPGEGTPQITSLMRWRSSERSILFAQAQNFLSGVPLSPEYFPKVAKNFEDLYLELQNSPTLSEICVNQKTRYSLHVPSAPRYFIPALKTQASRSSQHQLFFRNAQDRDLAYLLINSSLAYWWWRVRDGGMTLAQQTLLSIPIPEFEPDLKIIRALERSESANKVYKINAGVAQENVKHPTELLDRVNKLVMPRYADKLILMHRNSDLDHLPSELSIKA